MGKPGKPAKAVLMRAKRVRRREGLVAMSAAVRISMWCGCGTIVLLGAVVIGGEASDMIHWRTQC